LHFTAAISGPDKELHSMPICPVPSVVRILESGPDDQGAIIAFCLEQRTKRLSDILAPVDGDGDRQRLSGQDSSGETCQQT